MKRYGIIQDGEFRGAITSEPERYVNAAFGASADDDTYRAHGFWPVVTDDPGPGAYEVQAGASLSADSEQEVIRETITYELPPVDELTEQRIGDLTKKRDQGIAAGATHTLPDGNTGTVSTDVPNSASRLAAAFARADRAQRKGESKTFYLTTQEGVDYSLSASAMAEAAGIAVDAANEWFKQWQTHKQAIQAIAADDALTDDEKRSQIAGYDDESENGGWPS